MSIDYILSLTLHEELLSQIHYKIHNKEVEISPENRLIPPSRLSRNMHNLSFQIPSTNSDYRKFSFFPRTIRDWNALPPDIVAAGSLVIFKKRVSLHNPQMQPSVYSFNAIDITVSSILNNKPFACTQHGKIINPLMVAIKRQKQKKPQCIVLKSDQHVRLY